MLRSFLAAVLLLQLFAGAARACETVKVDPSQVREAAVPYFESVDFVYEGILLGPHDYDRGGRFLVIGAHKGPARPFDVLTLPPGNSCYSGLPPFGVWAGNAGDRSGIAAFVSKETVSVWREEGLLTADVSGIFAIGALLLVALSISVVWVRFSRRKSRAG